MADCLTAAEIQELLADTLSPDEKVRAERHLAECEKCRQEVERLRADDELFGKIKQACEAETVAKRDEPADSHARRTPPTESIEGYEILSEVHRGGQGVVYKAVQKTTKRTVALKVLLEGPYASPRQRHRFEREIDLVASLQHRNIVTVYDSGVTRDGRHFFAMEYIHGQALDAYLSDKNLSIDETLRLFQKTCAAVNHAHQHGVIHRDLKPGNIRVDANGEPHVLDFGLAKAGAGGLTPDGAPVTVTGEFMGTLAYASPEQTKGDPTLIDIRTDVYSLGVILYEMLTGKYPYQVVGQMADVLRNIAEAEPKRPSTIRRQINDEVETIVLKALAKERERRYQSADTLGCDIEHYLNGQPIDAKRDSGWYVLRKTLRRYRGQATAAAGYLVIVTIALMVSVASWRQATEQRDRARLAENDARQAQLAEAEQRCLADETKEQAETDRDRATAAEKRAQEQRDLAFEAEREAQRQAYFANIAAASAALSANEVATVRRRLDAAPPEFCNWEWQYLHAEADQSLATLRGHEGYVSSVTFSPDGSRLASTSFDRTVRLWKVSTGKELAVLPGHSSYVLSVSFSPDGTRLASASFDKTIRIWNASTGDELAVLRGHEDRVMSVAFSPDGGRLASASVDKTVRLWDTATGDELAVLRGHADFVFSVAFSPDGSRLVSASQSERPVRIWDATTGEELRALNMQDGSVFSVAFSPDGSRLASGSHDATVRIGNASTGEELLVMRGHEDDVNSVAFSPDGARLASASDDRTVRVWDTASGEELVVVRGHTDCVYSVAFSPDGTHVASASADDTVHIWDAASREGMTVLRKHEDAVTAVVFSPDDTRMASASHDKTVRIWDPATGEELAILRGHEAPINSVAFSPSGLRVASASGDEGYEDNTVRLWDAQTGEELAVLRGHEGAVWSVAFSPDGTRLASGSGWGRDADNSVRLWDASTGEGLAVLRRHEAAVLSIAFSPDSARLASASKEIAVWDASTGDELAVLRGHERGVHCVTFSPDGSRLALAPLDDGTVRLWDASNKAELAVLRGHERHVVSTAFSPDGTRLASASWDRTVRLWDTSTGEELVVLRGHEGEVQSVAFSADGIYLASASWDGTVRIWHAKPYRVRYDERQAIVAAQPEAERIVDALWQKHSDWRTAAQRLRQDTSLSDPVRRAALNEVLRRASGTGRTDSPASQPSLQAASKSLTQPVTTQESSTP